MYVTYWNLPRTRQITFDEILSGVVDVNQLKYAGDETSTRTVQRNGLNDRLVAITNVTNMITRLTEFNQKYARLEAVRDLSTHYYHFEIPKKTGGVRPIDAPTNELSDALVELRTLLKSFMIADYHTAAHAYINGRGTLSAIKKHQAGHRYTVKDRETGKEKIVTYENNWAVKFDFHGFFPSSTPEFIYGMFSKIYPFSLIMKDRNGYNQLTKAMRLCFLNGGLPQGTPISPWITNVMMIPFDYMLNKKLSYKYTMKDGISRTFTYTRYADDITISCYLSFDPMEMQDIIKETLDAINAPFTLNEEKTHYGNRHSSENWMLGLMWNANNDITVGWRNFKDFKKMASNYIVCKKEGKTWDLEDLQQFNGRLNYYRMVEKEAVDTVISRYNEKYRVDMMAMLKADLKPKEGVVF